MGGVALAEAAVDAVGNHDEVGAVKGAVVVDLNPEDELHPKLAGPLLEDEKEAAARAAAEAVAADAMDRALEVDGDVVPVGEFLRDAPVARRVVALEIVEGGVGEHDAEAERVVRSVALEGRHLGRRPLLLDQDREVKPRRSAADHRDPHAMRSLACALDRTPARILLSLKHFGRQGRPGTGGWRARAACGKRTAPT
jgi:hypothetical protein